MPFELTLQPTERGNLVAMIRGKAPAADLRRTYNKVFGICTFITFVAHTMVAVIYPTFDADASGRKKQQIIIETVDIPETQQIKRPPPPPRPAVPIETESDDVPDDVTSRWDEMAEARRALESGTTF